MNIEPIINAYYQQITVGCGKADCDTPYCRSNPHTLGILSRKKRKKFTTNSAKFMSYQLAASRGRQDVCPRIKAEPFPRCRQRSRSRQEMDPMRRSEVTQDGVVNFAVYGISGVPSFPIRNSFAEFLARSPFYFLGDSVKPSTKSEKLKQFVFRWLWLLNSHKHMPLRASEVGGLFDLFRYHQLTSPMLVRTLLDQAGNRMPKPNLNASENSGVAMADTEKVSFIFCVLWMLSFVLSPIYLDEPSKRPERLLEFSRTYDPLLREFLVAHGVAHGVVAEPQNEFRKEWPAAPHLDSPKSSAFPAFSAFSALPTAVRHLLQFLVSQECRLLADPSMSGSELRTVFATTPQLLPGAFRRWELYKHVAHLVDTCRPGADVFVILLAHQIAGLWRQDFCVTSTSTSASEPSEELCGLLYLLNLLPNATEREAALRAVRRKLRTSDFPKIVAADHPGATGVFHPHQRLSLASVAQHKAAFSFVSRYDLFRYISIRSMTEAATIMKMNAGIVRAMKRNTTNYHLYYDMDHPVLFPLEISRSEALRQLRRVLRMALADPEAQIVPRNPVRVQFSGGELGLDEGGIQMELFAVLAEQMLDPSAGLFRASENGEFMWFVPGPATTEVQEQYELCGMIFGMAIYNGCSLPVSFPLPLYMLLEDGGLLGAEDKGFCGLLALELEPSLWYSWLDILGTAAVAETINGTTYLVNLPDLYPVSHPEETAYWRDRIYHEKGAHYFSEPGRRGPREGLRLGEDFSFQYTYRMASGEVHTVPLPNLRGHTAESWGSADTSARVKMFSDYVNEYAHYAVFGSASERISAFLRGFRYFIRPEQTSLFSPLELRRILEGQHEIDVGELRRTVSYIGIEPDYPPIKYLWNVLHRFTHSELQAVLHFIRGSPRVHVCGYEAMGLKIRAAGTPPTHLPTSQTCFSTLYLPEYESEEQLEKMMRQVIEHKQGFGFM